jgi:uncharacterized membrane protein
VYFDLIGKWVMLFDQCGDLSNVGMWMLRAAKCIAIRFLASKGTSTTLTASLPSTIYFFGMPNHYFFAKSVNFDVFVGVLDVGMICFVNFFY